MHDIERVRGFHDVVDHREVESDAVVESRFEPQPARGDRSQPRAGDGVAGREQRHVHAEPHELSVR
jgi:hypothetical protein